MFRLFLANVGAITRIVSPQIDRDDVDQSVALVVAKELVAKQNALFSAMGVQFPKWMGKPISLKNMEHCLGQYDRYYLIISDACQK